MAFPANIDLSSLNGSNGFKLSGASGGDLSGRSVSSAGDVNGDGFDDLIVGADGAVTNGVYGGASYVVFGKASGFAANIDLSSLNGSTGFELSGVSTGDISGHSVSSAGDVNGDGFADLIVGAWRADPNGTDSGASYVVFGKAAGFAASIALSSLNGSTGFTLSGVAAGDRAGTWVSSAGDVNGDGFADLIIGARGADPNGTYSGASYVVFGKASGFAANIELSSLDGSTGFKLSGVAADDQTITSNSPVSSAGDVNGDGYDDLIIGARGADPNGSASGASYVVFGKAAGFAANLNLSSLDGSTGFKLSGVAADDFSGFSVSSAGDVNGDGFDDLIVGAQGAEANAAGASYVVFGHASGFAANIELSSLDGFTGFKVSGAALLELSGTSVSSAGDVNGDGFDDLIIGARRAAPNGTYSGAAYVLFGKGSAGAANVVLSSLDGTNGFKLSGVAAYDLTGDSVSSAGDVNGDGFDDLIVGAVGADPNGSFSGASYVVFGGAFGATVTTTGTAAAEMLVGGTGNDTLTGGGGADVFQGGAGNDRLVIGDLAFRFADGGAGTDTLALAGTGQSLDLTYYAHLGKLDGIERIDLTGSGNNTLTASHLAVLGGFGAVTGGRHVLAVEGNAGDTVMFSSAQWMNTASFTDGNGTFNFYVRGNAEVHVEQGLSIGFAANLALSSLDGSTGFKLSGVAAEDRSGRSVSSAGDVNGDGFDDLIIGAREADPNGSNSGASYVVFGKASGFAANINLSSLDGSTGFKLSGVAANDYSGNSVSSAGDVNGDGFADLVVGAFGAAPNGSRSGASYVVFGKASGFAASIDLVSLNGSTGFKLSGVTTSDYSGFSVSSAGDVNGDGFADLIVGAFKADPNGSYSGASYVVFGKASGFAANVALSSLDGSAGFKLSGVTIGDYSGRSVSSAGDVNGDGFDDLIVGAASADPNGLFSGASYVVFGKASGFAANLELSSLNGSTGFKLNGAAAGDSSGNSVSSAGDVNGDGFDDLIVGAYTANTSSGVSYVVFGKASGFAATVELSSLNGSTGFRLSGAAAGDYSGFSVASAGDVNGDGFADLIVGASKADPNGSNSGASYVVFGKASGFAGTVELSSLNGSTGFKLSGVAGSDFSGRSVSSAGDVNGDGFADLVVGAPYADPNGSQSGASYVVFGGAFGATVGIIGTSAANLMVGGTGADGLNGGAGADVIHGGAGNDHLWGGAGADVLDGGGGIDFANYSTAVSGVTASLVNPAVNTGDAAGDRYLSIFGLIGSNFDDVLRVANIGGSIWANAGNDFLFGGAGSDDLHGMDGIDHLLGGTGADVLDGGNGIDFANYSTALGPVLANLLAPGGNVGEAAGDSYSSIEGLIGSAFDDTLRIGNSGGSIWAIAGNDFLFGGAGSDDLHGMDGIDHLLGGAAADTLDGGNGIDFANYSTALGPVLANLLAPGGNVGEAAGDSYSSVEGLIGSAFDDTLRIGNGGGSIWANAGNDHLFGGAGSDDLHGMDGIDHLLGGAGADVLDGGAGIDFANYSSALGPVLANLIDSSGNVGEAAGDQYASVEGLIGSNFGDTLRIGNGGGSIWALDGNDFLFGGAGGDDLHGMDGIDHLLGGAGADVLDGGAGIDFANYSNALGPVLANLIDSSGNVGEAAGDQYGSVEGLIGSNFGDTLRVGNGGGSIWANAGNDHLFGGAGGDDLHGMDGIDHLLGGAGADVLDGGAGTDFANYSSALGPVLANLIDSSGNTGEAAGDQYGSVEGLIGSTFGDTLHIGNGGGSIWAIDGDDMLFGGAGNDDLHGGNGADGLFGSGGVDLLDGGAGDDAFVFGRGSANGDTVLDFTGNGAAVGDRMIFSGYGTAGASFTQVDATHWSINSSDGAVHDVLTLSNAASIHVSDYLFV